MGYKNVFERYEIKYLLTESQRKVLLAGMNAHMRADCYGKSTIRNIYYDRVDFRLIRRSLEKPAYKEKLRVRSYGTAGPEDTVFVELKKKYRGVVYKRRMSTKAETAQSYLAKKTTFQPSTQISTEIDYFINFYAPLFPTAYISYEREAFYGIVDSEFRVTFDRNILWRDYDLSLHSGIYGSPLLNGGESLMEIKTATAIPLWMSDLLCKLELYKTSFSKYGNAYQQMQYQKTERRKIHA